MINDWRESIKRGTVQWLKHQYLYHHKYGGAIHKDEIYHKGKKGKIGIH